MKNISPTWNQISSTDIFKFKDGSDLEVFHNNVTNDLILTQADILDKNLEFSGTSSTDMTGVVSNLTQLKKLVDSGNNGMQEIVTFNPLSLNSMSPAQVTAKANDRSGKNLNIAKINEITERIKKINEGLDGLSNYINDLSINNTVLYFDSIIQAERFKNQNVEILDTRKTDMTQNMDIINTNTNMLKATFTNARGIYNTISHLNNSIIGIVAQRTIINALDPLCLPNLCGCDANHYKPICDVLDNLVATLQGNIADLNDKIDKIHSYPGDYGQVQPFVEINQSFSPTKVSTEIAQTKTTMNTFTVSSDPDKKEMNKGMNLTTSDRPIDNIRNITFKGI